MYIYPIKDVNQKTSVASSVLTFIHSHDIHATESEIDLHGNRI